MSLNDEMEKTQERNDKVLQEVGDLKVKQVIYIFGSLNRLCLNIIVRYLFMMK